MSKRGNVSKVSSSTADLEEKMERKLFKLACTAVTRLKQFDKFADAQQTIKEVESLGI